MVATLPRMAKKAKEPTDQIRLPQSFLRRLRRIAGHLDRDPQEYIVSIAMQQLGRDEAQMLKDLQQEQAGMDEPAPRRKRSD